MKNKINLGIILSALILLIIVNYDYCRCFCLFTNKVCVYIKNESGQSINSGYLTAYQNDTINFYTIKTGNDICIKYISGGENAFTVSVNLSDNQSFQYGPEYSEDGYCFDLIVTSEKIESK